MSQMIISRQEWDHMIQKAVEEIEALKEGGLSRESYYQGHSRVIRDRVKRRRLNVADILKNMERAYYVEEISYIQPDVVKADDIPPE